MSVEINNEFLLYRWSRPLFDAIFRYRCCTVPLAYKDFHHKWSTRVILSFKLNLQSKDRLLFRISNLTMIERFPVVRFTEKTKNPSTLQIRTLKELSSSREIFENQFVFQAVLTVEAWGWKVARSLAFFAENSITYKMGFMLSASNRSVSKAVNSVSSTLTNDRQRWMGGSFGNNDG